MVAFIISQFRQSSAQLGRSRTLTFTALLVGLGVVLDALHIQLQLGPMIRVDFSFVGIALIGLLFGPVPAMTAGAAEDFLGWLVNTSSGAYFPGFTLTAILAGAIWGVMLYQRPLHWTRILSAKLCINLFLNCILNSVWLSVYYGKSFSLGVLPLRFLKNLAALPLEVLLVYAAAKLMLRVVRPNAYRT
ncbi:MAG: folate family ECF transporter S component [Candidatus Fournierella pullistercoris]|uniref:Folate family ECF transporter S component n=1 Tax=Candidatus Allofournierella pullistercoris TaxID=2838597 RepID=A0A948T0U1_9FIRM|nr:folate family ECF transporter S component [Candidatus Fournierella pullistercoris]